MSIDPVSRDIFQHELIGVAEEMSVALRRSAYSSIIWDMYDYACGLLLPNGDMIAQAETIPAQLGIMPTAVQHILEEIPLSEWRDGDVIVCNDPYRGCTHTMDIVLFSPVFFEGEIIAIASTIAHHIDIGGKVPGSEAADSVELFEEGLILPPLKLLESGVPNDAIFAIVKANVRDPRASLGDLRAQIAGCRTGENRLRDLCKRHGKEKFRALAEACLDYTQAYIQNALGDVGQASNQTSVLIEDDVSSDQPIRIQAAVTIKGGRLKIDFSGTSEQRENGLNCPASSTISMVHYAVKAVFAPGLPQNEGCNRPIDIRVPQGCLLAPKYPAAVSAGAHVSFPTFCAGGVDDRKNRGNPAQPPTYYVISDIIGGGMGGFQSDDGMNAIDTHGGNCAILSAEIMEQMSPFRVLRSELIPNSGGRGAFRGGLGIRRDYQLLGSSSIVSGYLQQSNPGCLPWGFEGGENGGPSAATLNPGTNHEHPLTSKWVAVRMQSGDVIRLDGAGGGGWGKPTDRTSEMIDRDLHEGYVTAQK
ncbi:MAG: hydantoinase B/oxoprolinase family protein [Alphaproteobacteria bacterium]|nr:hydantoinase B/oxoprolinase family protein [Alphaproteobacteria bacterium]